MRKQAFIQEVTRLFWPVDVYIEAPGGDYLARIVSVLERYRSAVKLTSIRIFVSDGSPVIRISANGPRKLVIELDDRLLEIEKLCRNQRKREVRI
jgi:hypothetical protein